MALEGVLEHLECPINWGLPDTASAIQVTKERVLWKVDNAVDDDDDSITWQKISQLLVMAYFGYKSPDNGVQAMDKYLKKIEDVLMEDKGDNILMKKHMPSVEYVTIGMRAHWYFKQTDKDKAKACIARLDPFDELSEDDQAACYALKACCFMEFAGEGFDGALESIEKALALDPEDYEWNFLKGKCLARSRRFISRCARPCIEELRCLGKAAQSPHCSHYHLVFCAQSLFEYGENCIKEEKDPSARLYFTDCAKLFRRAADKAENNAIVLVRVAKGLMHMWGYGIEDLLERCLFRALELNATSGFVNAVVGEYYYVRGKDSEKAIPYLRTASRHFKIFSSYRYLLTILYYYKSRDELHEEMEIFWKNYKDNLTERVKALKIMMPYFFLVRNDIVTAAFYCKEWLERTYKDKRDVNDNNYMFLFCHNLTAAIVGEVNVCLYDPRSKLYSDEEDELRSFLQVVQETRPNINIGKTRTPREETIKVAISKSRDREKKNILIAMYNVKPTLSGYSKNSTSRYSNSIRRFPRN